MALNLNGLTWDQLAQQALRNAQANENTSIFDGRVTDGSLINGPLDLNGEKFSGAQFGYGFAPGYGGTDSGNGPTQLNGVTVQDPTDSGYHYVLSKNSDGSIAQERQKNTSDWDFLSDMAKFAATAYGMNGLVNGLGASSLGTSETFQPLPSGGMTATGTPAPWEVVSPELGSGMSGTSVSDIGSLMGTSGGVFDLGTGLSGITSADLASTLGSGISGLDAAKAIGKVASALKGGSSPGLASSARGFSGVPNEIYNMNPGMLQIAAAPAGQTQQASVQPLMIQDYKQPDFGYDTDSKLAKLAKMLQEDSWQT